MATETVESTAGQQDRSVSQYLANHLRDYGMVLALIAIMAFFQFTTDGTLLRPVNITNLFLQNSYIIIMALGMLLVIVAGHIDLSVGSVVGFVGALAAVMMVQWGWSIYLTIPACLFVGILIGAAQGYWIAYWRIPSFIVTLAGMLVFRGASLWLLEGQSVGPFPREFQALSTGFIPDLLPFIKDMFGFERMNGFAVVTGFVIAGLIIWMGLQARARNRAYGMVTEPMIFFVVRNLLVAGAIVFVSYKLATFRGLPNVLITMGILTIVYAFLTESTTLGRRIYALGGNEKAAKLSGIRTERLTFLAFVNMGMLAALAGLIFAARLNTATPKAGVSFELDVIAAVFIGGASMSGGVGKIVGAVVGAFIMGVMNNGMSIMGIGIDYQQVIKGLVLLAAVIFDVYNKNKQS
ncbi:MAG: sugar ABC transporter permease [Hoeflea sp.]|uniref:multiple monosaccharide ABC transporter permease n=1 Tax=Hoeflea sp. TaxID=1940281 RepID=UPI001D705381|nr:multiple monosaccharide ABC transporter permease [Hoeflea sp.]MBU4529524.1 sugar ABC transporter permease [Alphaproteobacteria bacterium]MBU4546643.1 sugar ABC transporter permease [Alphaproteobacteria bacterium]MBU4550911.1 sugar ABC transporter permease [Alphaproteobacteria bacterium]MBV1723853.1 sugar ABC transporter permease [Hoeflea sp.]MBV1763130.1 sugar ABC transporter permease [Hoeflea sp.]